MLNLFYGEPDGDRWFTFDRYPRKFVRRIVRGKPRPGGQMRVFLNLCAGLDRLGATYRVNDYRYIKQHRDEVACIVGKPVVLDKIEWRNPILFGAAVFSHPIDNPILFERYPVRKVLVPGEWMRKMWEPTFGDRVSAWPVGIDTQRWIPSSDKGKEIDVLLYDKVRWEHARYEIELIAPIRRQLVESNLRVAEIRYGYYREEDFHSLLMKSKAMIFLCEHETQGIAYQQALSCNVPIIAWDRGGYWQDPTYFPHKVRFAPVSSVPYWDERCGIKFSNTNDFPEKFGEFCDKLNQKQFAPRAYILENLTLEKCAEAYLKHVQEVHDQ